MKEDKAVKKIMDFVEKEFKSVPRVEITPDITTAPTSEGRIMVRRDAPSYIIQFIDCSEVKE